jgi:hypothetical protein
MPAFFKRKRQDENFDALLKQFMKFSAEESTSDLSVIEQAFAELQAKSHNSDFFDPNIINSMKAEKKVRATDTNKAARLQYYYSMARYQEVSDAIDEICEASLNYDEDGKIINLTFTDQFPSKFKKQFEEEFTNILAPLRLEQNMYKFMKEFIITGELCFENVVNPRNMDAGIVDYTRIPAHSFEFAIDVETKEKVGIIVRVNSLRETDLNVNNYSDQQGGKDKFRNDFQKRYGVKLDNLDKQDDIINGECLFMPWSQLLYCFLDSTNVNETIILPLLYKARRAYNQLMSMEDAIIIYTISRSPVRMMFQVGMGSLPPGKQRDVLNKYIKKYTNRMSYDKETGTVQSGRDTHTMIESFWFARPAGAPETDVSQIGGDANFGDLEGLRYFQQKVYKALKIPSKRLVDAGDTNWTKDTDQITYEEFAFAQMIIRLTNRLALGLKDAFITHLKFIGVWEQIEEQINESAFDIEFVKPIAYDIYQQKVTLENKMEMFERVTSTDYIDPVMAMKKYLGMTDQEIEANFESMKETKIRLAKIEHEAQNWTEYGQAKKPEEEMGGF